MKKSDIKTDGTISSTLRSQLGVLDIGSRMVEMAGFKVPTGNIAFDIVTHGGIPACRLTEIFGDFSSGKSRLAYHILAETQKANGIAVLLDTERGYDEGLATLTGLNSETLILPDPNTKLGSIEDVFEVMEACTTEIRKEAPDQLLTICWDSVAATPGIGDMEGDLGAPISAMRRAKIISDGLKRLMADVYRNNICLVFVNQIRDKIGVAYGEKIDTVGGKALKFTASMRMHIRASGKIKNEKTQELDGFNGVMIVEKCKVGRPYGRVNFEMLIDSPISKYSGLRDYMCRHMQLETVAPGWYKFPDFTEKFRDADFPEFYEAWKEQSAAVVAGEHQGV